MLPEIVEKSLVPVDEHAVINKIKINVKNNLNQIEKISKFLEKKIKSG